MLPLPARPLLIQTIVWLLAMALMIYGQRSLVVQVLGPEHRHAGVQAPAPAPWTGALADTFRDIKAWRDGLQARWLGRAAPHQHGSGVIHRHDGYQRHHHAPSDASVQALDASANDATAQAAYGSATLPMAMCTAWILPALVGAAAGWPACWPASWRDARQRLPERPPRA